MKRPHLLIVAPDGRVLRTVRPLEQILSAAVDHATFEDAAKPVDLVEIDAGERGELQRELVQHARALTLDQLRVLIRVTQGAGQRGRTPPATPQTGEPT